jgi:hypothetical protein
LVGLFAGLWVFEIEWLVVMVLVIVVMVVGGTGVGKFWGVGVVGAGGDHY